MADQKKLEIILEAHNKTQGAFQELSNQLTELVDNSNEASSQLLKTGGSAKQTGLSFTQLVTGVTAGNLAAQAIIASANRVVDGLKNMSISAVRLGVDMGLHTSQVNEAQMALDVVAQKYGYTAQEADKMAKSVEAQNLTRSASVKLTTEVIRSEIGLAKASELAARAQDLATLSGRSSSETIETITHAIRTDYPMVLQQIGITKTAGQMYDQYATSIGKSRDELTDLERRQAVANAVIEEGNKIMGLYDQSLASGSKSLRSLIDRFKMMSEIGGNVFAPILDELIPQLNRIATSLVDFLRMNEDTLRALGQVLSDTVMQPFREFFATIEAGLKPITDLKDKMRDGTVTQEEMAEATRQVGENFAWMIGPINAAVNFTIAFTGALNTLIQSVIIGGATLVQGARNFWNFGRIAYNVAKLDFENANTIYKSMQTQANNYVNFIDGRNKSVVSSVDNMWKGLTGNAFNLQEFFAKVGSVPRSFIDGIEKSTDAVEEMSAKTKEKLQDVADKMKELTEDFEDQMKKRTISYERSLDDILFASMDRRRKLEQDLSDETKNYQNEISKRTETFEEHLKKIQKKLDDSRADINKKYEEDTTKIKENLLRQLSAGSEADETFILAAKRVLEERKKKRDEDLLDLEQNTQEEITEVKDKHAQELEELAKKNRERTDAIQVQLNKELDFQNKYSEEFKRIEGKRQLDAIESLRRSHHEQLQEMKMSHDKRLAELVKQQNEIRQVQGLSQIQVTRNGQPVGSYQPTPPPTTSSSSSQQITNYQGPIGPSSPGSVQGTANTMREYVVQPGDSLSSISAKFLGSANRWQEIKGYSGDPRRLPIGQKLLIPRAQEGLFIQGSGPKPIIAHGGETILTQTQTRGLLRLLERFSSGTQVSDSNGGKMTQINRFENVKISGDYDVDALISRLSFLQRTRGGIVSA